MLACPPHLLDKNCLSCSFQPGLDRVPLGTDARHFVRCRKGLRLHGAVSDKVRDELCFILERCGIRTIAERPLSHRQKTLSNRADPTAFEDEVELVPNLVTDSTMETEPFTAAHEVTRIGSEGYSGETWLEGAR